MKYRWMETLEKAACNSLDDREYYEEKLSMVEEELSFSEYDFYSTLIMEKCKRY